MKIKVTFTHKGKKRKYEFDESELSRNYDDEGYAEMLITMPKRGRGTAYYEINILKTQEVDGELMEDGYVALYENEDDSAPYDFIDAKVKFLG